MLFALEQGPHAEKVIRGCIARRKPIPELFDNAPELVFGLELYYEAFYELQAERVNGVIPRSSIVAYCKDEGLDREQFEDMATHFQTMQTVLSKFEHKRAKDNTDVPEGGLGRGAKSKGVRQATSRIRK